MSRLTPWAKGRLDIESIVCGQENSDYMIIQDVNGLAQYLLGISEGVNEDYNSEHPDEPEIEVVITFARKLNNGMLQVFTINKNKIEYGLMCIPENTSVHVELTAESTEPPPVIIVASTT